MLKKMTREQFIESMRNAREEKEYVNMADVAKISEEVKEAVGNGTGRAITCMAEPTDKPKRGRKPGNKVRIPASWQESIKASIDLMLAESGEKIEQAKELIGEAEERAAQAETLGGMIR